MAKIGKLTVRGLDNTPLEFVLNYSRTKGFSLGKHSLLESLSEHGFYASNYDTEKGLEKDLVDAIKKLAKLCTATTKVLAIRISVGRLLQWTKTGPGNYSKDKAIAGIASLGSEYGLSIDYHIFYKKQIGNKSEYYQYKEDGIGRLLGGLARDEYVFIPYSDDAEQALKSFQDRLQELSLQVIKYFKRTDLTEALLDGIKLLN